ncbi:Proton-coupled folate transporter [Mizuhopecten yessoensis]|uniref:Proton-coupled folate transporter n=1 Tax=Mizuhopecten yessoensis TaxID=6573 RepID=A0A210QE99_MIZYE|nr:Proton-coupled folate transporter [Mizuhopecten yessoensis]
MLSLTYSFVLAHLVIVQYVYAYIHKAYYPNVSFSTNESGCQLNTTSRLYHDQQNVQKMTSQFNIYAELAKGIFGIFFYGSLSDKYGRKIFLFVPVIGNMLNCVLTSVGIYLNWNIYIFIIFFFIDGCGGSWGLAISIVMSIVADVTVPGKTRMFVIAMTELSLGLGIVIGSFTSGFIIEAEGFMSALLISSCCFGPSIPVIGFRTRNVKQDKRSTKKIRNSTCC